MAKTNMKPPEWNTLAGDLRSALAHNERGLAGRAIWKLKLLDLARYEVEFEEYTSTHLNKGEGMTLATEQRLEAVRQWARDGMRYFGAEPNAREGWLGTLARLAKGYDYSNAMAHFDKELRTQIFGEFSGARFDEASNRIVGYAEDRGSGMRREAGVILLNSCLDFEGGWSHQGLHPLRADMRDVLWLEIQGFETASRES